MLNVAFGAVNSKNMTTTCSIVFGENNQVGWSAHGKFNYANGWLYGVSLNTGVFNNMIDNDVIDTPIQDDDGVPSSQTQGL
ncbi:hypothetical protein EV207_11733 [Scopulibacillus darangshiensis]|uniref:Uncharacterized protein n=1 Tax=Scopulibacillus darangshiensis TaxID=442528 RepID=A0A4V2SMM0_9BACL|nr:hypothetical protein [Scopulibacillus darangshiensis]TCP27806.1 hypothetical protein EV207_11733 [Scopulibacillus darangshiensis]